MGAKKELARVFFGKINHSVEAHMKNTFGKIRSVDHEGVGNFDDFLDIWTSFAVTREADGMVFGFKNQSIRGNHGGVVDLKGFNLMVFKMNWVIVIFFNFRRETHPGIWINVLVKGV